MRRILIVLAAVTFLASGCAKDESTLTSPSPTTAATMAATQPTLTITSPKDGDTISGPMKVTFSVTGFEMGSAPKGHFHALWGTGANDYAAFTGVTGNSGTVTASKNPPSSVHDVTFQLANANHSLLTNASAKVTVKNLTFE